MSMLSDQLYYFDELAEKASQPSALLFVINRAGYENFSLYSQEIKENYLWTYSGLADQLDKLIKKPR